MAPATGSDAAARSPIGLQNITELVLERINTYLAQTTRPEAWVVGVFGEWGSGKSTLLAEIARHFPNVPIEKPGDTAPITLRIEFNAWRYEREEHLLVPLLRTIERTLDDYADAIDALPIVEHPGGGTCRSRRPWPEHQRRVGCRRGGCLGQDAGRETGEEKGNGGRSLRSGSAARPSSRDCARSP